MKTLTQLQQGSQLHWVGNGFPVRSVFGYDDLGRQLSPFLLLDYAAPHVFPPGTERRGVAAHPHRGFETVTIAYQGMLEHHDSSGGGGKIGPGDVQWMTAASGIIHEEYHAAEFTRSGGTLEMIQLWVNLRAADKNAPPGYQTLLAAEIPTISLPQEMGSVRVIAGDYAGHKGPAKTFTPINLWDVTLYAGKTLELPLPDGHHAALFVVRGSLLVNGGHAVGAGMIAAFSREGAGASVQAAADVKLVVMTGEPIDEPIVGQGPFVMNTREEIEQAFADFRRGRFGTSFVRPSS